MKNQSHIIEDREISKEELDCYTTGIFRQAKHKSILAAFFMSCAAIAACFGLLFYQGMQTDALIEENKLHIKRSIEQEQKIEALSMQIDTLSDALLEQEQAYAELQILHTTENEQTATLKEMMHIYKNYVGFLSGVDYYYHTLECDMLDHQAQADTGMPIETLRLYGYTPCPSCYPAS